MRLVRGMGALAAALTVLIVPAAALAQTTYGGDGLTLGTNSVSPGQSTTVSGTGFAPNSPVTITFTSTPVVLTTVTTTATGTFQVTVTIPANATAGAHTITASGTAADGSARILTQALTVTGTSGGGLVRTGGDSGGLLRWAAALVAVGFILVVSVSLRRRRGHAQTVR